jgi:NAD(P)-dependent dehydrogenase (short-subunit alcohol dehydrogenase family)
VTKKEGIMIKLEGKVSIVTGGGSGIGRASAVLLAKEGAEVVVVDINEKGGKEVETEISKAGGKATFFKADVSRANEVEAIVLTAVEKYGRLDVLFNNAGITGPRANTADCSLENWQKVIDVDLTGVFLGMKYGIPAMLKNGGGSIINTSSTAGIGALPGDQAYCAAKAGVIMLTKTAAVEYGSRGIRVNAILPGGILTPVFRRAIESTGEALKMQEMITNRFPIGRLGQPEEVANLVLFLASDDSSYITASSILFVGGFMAK